MGSGSIKRRKALIFLNGREILKSNDSGLMFPKPEKKKKRKRHARPIVPTMPGECFLCAADGDRRRKQT